MKSALCTAVFLVASAATHAADRVFECKDASGKTTYTNVPCEGQALKPEALEDSAYKSPFGEWLGQVQFKETTAKGGAAHAVAPVTLMIEPGGRLTGASNETGCRMLGLASPGAAPNVVSLDVTLRDCHEEGFSRHYNGTLALYPAQHMSQLYLISIPIPGEAKVATHDLSGTMRR